MSGQCIFTAGDRLQWRDIVYTFLPQKRRKFENFAQFVPRFLTGMFHAEAKRHFEGLSPQRHAWRPTVNGPGISIRPSWRYRYSLIVALTATLQG